MVCSRSLIYGPKMRNLLIVLAFTITILALPLSQGYTYEQDVYAINNLFTSLGSPLLPGWIANGGDPCMEMWQGVQCVNSNITGIVLNGANLGGELGDKLGNFTSMITIDLGNNHIGGPIPYNLPTTIRSFFLSSNKLTGSIPGSLSTLGLLSDLSLSDNLLSGELPDAFQGLTGLVNLDLSSNNLSGQLPPSMANLSSLTTLHVQENQLTGYLNILQDLPLIDFSCSVVQNRNIENNSFWGPIPAKLLSLPNFEKDGNPFNTTVLPSPPTVSPTMSLPPIFPPPASPPSLSQTLTPPGNMGNGQSTPDGQSTQNGPKTSWFGQHLVIVAVALIGSALIIVALLCLWRKCCNREFEVMNGGSVLLGTHSSKKPFAKLRDMPSTNQMDKDPIQSKVGQMAADETDSSGRVFSSMSQRTDKAIRNHAPPSKSREHLEHTSVKSFTVSSLQQCTNNFSEDNLIGGNTQSTVYWAQHPNGQLLAVKKLNNAIHMLHSDEAFLRLVSIISKLQHKNIEKLVGYCQEYDQQILVFEHCSNGSLENCLHSSEELKKKLSWDARIQIAIGAANALEYLHEVCQPPVMHCRISSANLLLDDKFVVRVSECGFASLIKSEFAGGMSGNVQTSIAYGAPEIPLSGKYTCQNDVYSFGVVMLELLTGRKAYDKSQPYGEQYLVKWARNGLHDITSLLRMADPSLNPKYIKKSLSAFADIISLCIQSEPLFRPPISEIARMLQFMPMESSR